MLQDIDQVTLLLQKRMITLSKAQRLLTNLLLDINTASLNVNARLHNCLLGSKWIGAKSQKLKSPHFHGGVIKIQQGETYNMTPEERTACESLLLLTNNEYARIYDEDPIELSFVDRQQKRDMMEHNSVNNEYRNADFILGSNAESERIWSHAKLILTSGRSRLTPYLFESILFLKFNSRLLDCVLIQQALEEVRVSDRENRAASRRIVEHNELVAIMGDGLDDLEFDNDI